MRASSEKLDYIKNNKAMQKDGILLFARLLIHKTLLM